MNEPVNQAAYQLLQNKYDRLLTAATAARMAQQAYYGYRVKSEMDQPRKQQLLQESKLKERELDQIITIENKERTTGQQGLF